MYVPRALTGVNTHNTIENLSESYRLRGSRNSTARIITHGGKEKRLCMYRISRNGFREDNDRRRRRRAL